MHNENLCTIWKTMELPGKEWATVQPAHLDKQQLQFQFKKESGAELGQGQL